MKLCGKCKETKPFEAFSKSAKKGYQSYCRICNKAHKREWIVDNRDKVQKNTLWSRYRLRPEAYDTLKALQDNKCAICSEEFSETPHVDHDHNCCPGAITCGECVRGLLCRSCNHMVGWYERMHSQDDTVLKITNYLTMPYKTNGCVAALSPQR